MQSYAFFRLRAIAYLRYFSSEKIVSRGRSRLKQPHCLSNIPTHDATTPPLPCESGFPGSSEGRSCSLRGPLRACVKAFLASSPRIFRLLYKSVSASIREALKTSPQKPLCRHSEKGRADGGGRKKCKPFGPASPSPRIRGCRRHILPHGGTAESTCTTASEGGTLDESCTNQRTAIKFISHLYCTIHVFYLSLQDQR